MLTRKNPPRAGNKPSATQPQPANHPGHPNEPLASGDAGAPSPTARRRRRGEMLVTPNDPGIYDADGMPIPDPESPEISRAGAGEESGEWIFRELIVPRKGPEPHSLPASFYYTSPNPREEMMREGLRPVPTTRSVLCEVGIHETSPEDQPYSMDDDPAHPVDIAAVGRVPPELDYQLTPPTANPMSLVSEFNPLELAAGDRNPTGSNHIVQSAEHAYALMAMEADGRLQAVHHMQTQQNQMHPRLGAGGGGAPPVGSVYVNGEGVAYASYADARAHGHMLRQHPQASPAPWQHQQHQHQQHQQQRTTDPPSGTWSTQHSPTSVPRGWQTQQQQQQQQPQTSPRNQGQDHPSASQHQHSPPPGMYRTHQPWPHTGQVQEPSQSYARDRATPPSPSPAFWRPGPAPGPGPGPVPGQGPSPQSAASTMMNVHQRDGSISSWPPQGGDPTRPPPSRPPSSIGAPPPGPPGPPGRYGPGTGPSSVTTVSPTGSWGPGHSMAGAPPPNSSGATWQGQPGQGQGVMQTRPSVASLQHQHQHHPHPEIDGPADGMRWSAPTSATKPSIPRGWQAPQSEGSGGNGAGGSTVQGSAGDMAGRTMQVRIYGSSADRMGSNQIMHSALAHQGNVRPPWMTAQQMNNPAGVPLDGRIQTPGGTGAMGAAVARPPTTTNPTPMASGGYAPTNNTQPGYPVYGTRPGSVHGQPTRPGDYGAAPGNEMSYNSQPDSVAAYRATNGPGGGMPPQTPTSVVPGGSPQVPQGYTMTGGHMPSGNPYPPVPPASSAPSYGVSRPGMIPQQQAPQQQHHQQLPPNAHGNMYPNHYTLPQQQPPPPSQGQGPGMNGSVYAPYTSGGGPPPVTYPMNAGGPMARTVTRTVPGPGGMQMNPYATMGAPYPQAQQEMFARMQDLPGAGGVDGYRPQQQQPPH